MASRLNALWKTMPDDVLSILHKVPNSAQPRRDPSDNPLGEGALSQTSLSNMPSQLKPDLDHGERTDLVKYLLLQVVRELDLDALPPGWRGDLSRRRSVVALRDLPRGLMLPSNNAANSDERQPPGTESVWTEQDERRLQREIEEREYRRQEAAGESQLHFLTVPQQVGNSETSIEAESNEGLQTPPEFRNFLKDNSSSRQSSFKRQSVTTGSPSEGETPSLNICEPEWSFEESSTKPANKAFLYPLPPPPSRGPPSSSQTNSDHASIRPLRPRSSRNPSSSRTVSDSASMPALPPGSLNNHSSSGSNTYSDRQRTSSTSLAEQNVQESPFTAASESIRQARKHDKDQKENGMVSTKNMDDFRKVIGSLASGDQNDTSTIHGRKTEGEASAFPVTRPDIFTIRDHTSFRNSGESSSSRSPWSSEREERKPQLSTIPMPAPKLRPVISDAKSLVFGGEDRTDKAYVPSSDDDFDDFLGIRADDEEQEGSVGNGKGKGRLLPSSEGSLPSKWSTSSLAALVTSDKERVWYVFMSDLKEEEVLNFDELPPRPHHSLEYDYQQVLLDIAALNITPQIRWRMLIELVRVMQYFMDEVKTENEMPQTEDLEVSNLSSELDRPISLLRELDHSRQRILQKLQRLPDSVQFGGNHIENMLEELAKHAVVVEFNLDLEWDRRASTATTLREARGSESNVTKKSSDGILIGVSEERQSFKGRQELNASRTATQGPRVGVRDEVQDTPSLIGLASLPLELVYEIFSHLVPVDSLLFGLTCKNCYQIHKKCYHRPIPPGAPSERRNARGFSIPLRDIVARMYHDLGIGYNGRLLSHSKGEAYKRQWEMEIAAFEKPQCKNSPEEIRDAWPSTVQEPEVQMPQDRHVSEEVQQLTRAQGSGKSQQHGIVENNGDTQELKEEQAPQANSVSEGTHRSHKYEEREEFEGLGGLEEHRGVQGLGEAEQMSAEVQGPQEAREPVEIPGTEGAGRFEDVHQPEKANGLRKTTFFGEKMRSSRGWSTWTRVRRKLNGRKSLFGIGFGPNATQQKATNDASGSLGQTAHPQESWRPSIFTRRGRQEISYGRTIPPIPGMHITRLAPTEPVISSEHIEHASPSVSPVSNEPAEPSEQTEPTRPAVSSASSYQTASSMPTVHDEIPAPVVGASAAASLMSVANSDYIAHDPLSAGSGPSIPAIPAPTAAPTVKAPAGQ